VYPNRIHHQYRYEYLVYTPYEYTTIEY